MNREKFDQIKGPGKVDRIVDTKMKTNQLTFKHINKHQQKTTWNWQGKEKKYLKKLKIRRTRPGF